jgi:hypothetical protein
MTVFERMFDGWELCLLKLLSGGFAAEELVFFLATAAGAAETAEKQDAYSHSDKHCEHGSERE